jgi:hypothetical protein
MAGGDRLGRVPAQAGWLGVELAGRFGVSHAMEQAPPLPLFFHGRPRHLSRDGKALTQGVVTMSVGRLPTLIGLPGVLVAVLIGVTLSENTLVT